MDEEKKKEGVSVKEIEGYAKKHRFEMFYALFFVLASLFTLVFWGAVFSIFLAGIGAILAVFFPEKVQSLFGKTLDFFFKQEGTTQMILGIVGLIVAIFLAPLVFLLMGLHGGMSLIMHTRRPSS
jgi:hypothetical protein